jgi:Ca2+-binding RTX toxin-like protein
LRAGLCAVVFTLLLAAPASAGTVYVSDGVLHFTAAPGEQNELVLTDVGTELRLLHGAGDTAGPGCAVHQAGQTQCAKGSITSVAIELGDQGDTFEIYPGVTLPVSVDGGSGNDTLEYGSTGAESFDGGEGDDALRADRDALGLADVFSGGAGRDTLVLSDARTPQSVTLDGVANDGASGEHDDVRPDFEVIYGSGGDDRIVGSDGDETFYGDDGADTLDGGGGADTLDGGGWCARDTLLGGAGNDTLVLSGTTTANGGADDDTFRVGGAPCGSLDDVSGGSGMDTADFSGSWRPGVPVSLDDLANDGPDLYTQHQNFHSDIETLKAGDGGMVLVGGPGPNTLIGGDGDDVLDGAGGTDVLLGGAGQDVADYSSRTAPVALNLDGLANDGAAGEGELLGADIEDLRGGRGNDTLTGDEDDHVLDGGAGPDTLLGGGGIDGVDYSARSAWVIADLDGEASDDGEYAEADTIGADVEGLFGGDGGDLLIGNGADGYLDGGAGEDYLADRGGADLLSGGWGADTIDSADGAIDSVDCGFGVDESWRDPLDEVDSCETEHDGPRTIPSTKPFEPQTLTIGTDRPPILRRPVAPPRARTDRTAPKATVLQVNGRLRSLSVVVRCNEACALSARLVRGNGPSLAKGAQPVAATTQRTLRLKLTRAGRRALRAGRYRLELTLSDGAGNARLVERSVKLRR